MYQLVTAFTSQYQAIKGKNKGNSKPCGRTKNEREQEAKPGPLSLFESTRSNLRHRDQAVPANNVDLFGSPDALPTAGASNLPCAGSPARSRRGDASFCSRSSHAPHGKARFPVHHNIVPALGDDELDQRVRGFGNAPPDTAVIADMQIPCLSGVTKFLVVVGPAPAGVLYAGLQIIKMDLSL